MLVSQRATSSIMSAFASLDTDGDGFISHEDLKAAIPGLDDESLKSYTQNADDHGRVTYQSFQAAMLREIASSNGKKVQQHMRHLTSLKRMPSMSRTGAVNGTELSEATIAALERTFDVLLEEAFLLPAAERAAHIGRRLAGAPPPAT